MYKGTENRLGNGSPSQPVFKVQLDFRLDLPNSKPFGHFVVKETFSRSIGLHPYAVNHELRDGAFARACDDFFRRARRSLDIDLFVGNVVFGQKALGFAAIRAPG
jgi:hypothetical protein